MNPIERLNAALAAGEISADILPHALIPHVESATERRDLYCHHNLPELWHTALKDPWDGIRELGYERLDQTHLWVQALEDESPPVRVRAYARLGRWQDALGDPHGTIRLHALVRFSSDALWEKATRDPDPAVRTEARKRVNTIEAWEAALLDPDRDCVLAAALALDTPEAWLTIATSARFLAYSRIRALRRIARRDVWEAALGDENPAVAAAAREHLHPTPPLDRGLLIHEAMNFISKEPNQ